MITLPHQASLATETFLASLRTCPPARIQARVASDDGMPLLCAVEAALAQALPAEAELELVWLTEAPEAGVQVLRLRAYAAHNGLLAEVAHEFRP